MHFISSLDNKEEEKILNLKSHIILSLFLAKRIRISCIPFLFGSVEPDLFVFSYLKGFLRTKRMSGHEYENMRIRSKKILKKIEGSRMLSSYRLGKLVHYLADSFTYAHNSCFEGNLKDHMLYEDRLLMAIEEVIRDEDVIPAFFSSAWDYVEKMHDEYLLKKHCEKTDAEYILSISFSVAFALKEEKALLGRKKILVSVQ